MTVFYAAVEDDPLTSGNGSRVHASGKVGTIKGEDGRSRRMAFIGDPAWCVACQSMGVIVGGAPVPENRRMLDLVNGGRRQAVGGDEVACKCAIAPRVIAMYGRKFIITGVSASKNPGESSRVATAAPSSRAMDERKHSCWCLVQDRITGERMANREFVAEIAGVRQSGKTDGLGYAKIETNGEQQFNVHVIFSSPKRVLKPRQGK